ncbi:hypothetical protein [Bradyrhizobium sp. HKCCYLS3013]|uniref:hypothetical protein n=1 Tax=Bradyrhizobium sp. HKCCYLS3013 TaxID=3420735 RepID=UPI003EB9A557
MTQTRLMCIESTPGGANAGIVIPGSSPTRAYHATAGSVIDVPGDVTSCDVQALLSAHDPLPAGTQYFILLGQSGATGARPTYPSIGQHFIDTTVGVPLWWDGAAWRDCSGFSH